MNGQVYVILAIIFVIIIAVFAVINVDPVAVNYLFWTQESPLILVILFSVLMGGLITAAVGAIRLYRAHHELKKLRTENERLKKRMAAYGLTDELNQENNANEKEDKKESREEMRRERRNTKRTNKE
ncbi:LapA family protein [Oceanobacillus jeddahense]|uniref:Lipopolysaccharide assembly protein LapA domain-containing protein n=1 Tax=Oceanobacillus jeddahense TaxID=1462527 RepID=A0ABY5JY74_9BACI|nr:lipopolysaccharide assembly protein LapA domain-containing protein [Oceanobacillus jeddahense]UUI05357.1 lipopolysaccharide assembly protein LapA domain-containing protein [Oceanobacillus jeddahense]